jgi:hypothetical protein
MKPVLNATDTTSIVLRNHAFGCLITKVSTLTSIRPQHSEQVHGMAKQAML